jgi:hypothetical protein
MALAGETTPPQRAHGLLRREATGVSIESTAPREPTPASRFKVMSIDAHTIDDGRMVRSPHIEDWIGAVRQLGAN